MLFLFFVFYNFFLTFLIGKDSVSSRYDFKVSLFGILEAAPQMIWKLEEISK